MQLHLYVHTQHIHTVNVANQQMSLYFSSSSVQAAASCHDRGLCLFYW